MWCDRHTFVLAWVYIIVWLSACGCPYHFILRTRMTLLFGLLISIHCHAYHGSFLGGPFLPLGTPFLWQLGAPPLLCLHTWNGHAVCGTCWVAVICIYAWSPGSVGICWHAVYRQSFEKKHTKCTWFEIEKYSLTITPSWHLYIYITNQLPNTLETIYPNPHTCTGKTPPNR